MSGVDISKVQQWVASALLFTMGMISTTCMAGYSVWGDAVAENGNAPGLWGMGVLVGVLTIAGCLLIHGRSPLSPLLLIGVIPAVVSAPFVF
jgi:hypothetical protein